MNDQSPRLPSGDGFADSGDDACENNACENDACENDASRELEQALATLRPSAGPIDRDRLMFLAGRAVVDRAFAQRPCDGGVMLSKWLWPSATAVSTIAATVLGLLLAVSHRPLIVREPAYPHDNPRHAVPPGQIDPYRGGPLPGAIASEDAGMPGTMIPGTMEMAVIARVDIARVDFVPRTSLPRTSYFQKRQVALSLGIEALGSQPSRGRAEQQVAYRELLSDMVDGME